MTRTSKKPFAQASALTYCAEGEVYIYPGIGPVICKGIDTIKVTGMAPVKTVVLEELYAASPRTPESKIASSGIREQADEATLDKALNILESASGKTHAPVSVSKRAAFYAAWLATPDILQLADLVAKTLGSDNSAQSAFKGRPSSGIEFGNNALTLLAREYALVKGVDATEAERILTEKSGKNRLLIAAKERENAENAVPEPVPPAIP